MSDKHTPGPWENDDGVIAAPREPYVIAVVTEVLSDKALERANADLLAAAPELFDLLDQAKYHVREIGKASGEAYVLAIAIDKLISKIEGK